MRYICHECRIKWVEIFKTVVNILSKNTTYPHWRSISELVLHGLTAQLGNSDKSYVNVKCQFPSSNFPRLPFAATTFCSPLTSLLMQGYDSCWFEDIAKERKLLHAVYVDSFCIHLFFRATRVVYSERFPRIAVLKSLQNRTFPLTSNESVFSLQKSTSFLTPPFEIHIIVKRRHFNQAW